MKTKFPLSQAQSSIFADCISKEDSSLYTIPYLFILNKNLDAERMCKAVETAVKAHPTLFTRIEQTEDGEAVQTIDIENEEFSIQPEYIDDIEQEKSRLLRPFQLIGGRLFQINVLLDAERVYLFCNYHHIISDGSTLFLILHDIESAYEGKEPEQEQLSLGEYSMAEQEARKTESYAKAREWYHTHFDCGDTFTQLIPDCHEQSPRNGSQTRILNTELCEVEQFCSKHKVFKSNFFTTAYAFLLAKFAGTQEALTSTVYNGRSDKRLSHTVGMFVKRLPVYIKFDNSTTVMDVLQVQQTQMSGCRSNDIFSYSDLYHEMGIQTDNIMAWHGTMYAEHQFAGTPMETVRLSNGRNNDILYLKVYTYEGRITVVAEYAANQYSDEIILQYLESYEAVIDGFLRNEYLRDIMISSPSQAALLDSFNDTDTPTDYDTTVVKMFHEQVAKHGEKVAVVYKDKHISYKELDEVSNRIAAYLKSKGLGKEDVVSILISRSEMMPITALGVLKAGCAYQPLDPTYPKERLNFMMKDANAKHLIAEADLCDLVDEYGGETLYTSDISKLPAADAPAEQASPEDLFILLYTSGTTGVPKGCQWNHRNIVSFVQMHQQNVHLDSSSKQTAYASFGFDANAMEMYPTLTIGATLYIIPEEMRLDLISLNQYLEENGITHLFMTTQVAYQFATTMENKSLKYLATGGEKLASLDPPKYKLLNIYGPTETVVYATSFPVERKMSNIPIGKAIANHKLYVVDNFGHRQPVGAVGELLISGPQVSRGYLNRPEKTSEVYIDNPYCENDPLHSRIYRTGDIVRYLSDGNIEFVGRRDGQVKIRGFRIELKEVEGVIRQFEGIKDVTVQAFDEEGGGKFIAAYVVSDQPVDIDALNQFIMEEKPPYMVPAVTMQIDAIPLNQNMKVNKRALPKPEKKNEAEETVSAPMNVLEEALHALIADITKTEQFGITTPLSYVGLTSISAIRLAVQVNKQYGVELDSRQLVKSGTLQQIENQILEKMLQDGGGSGAEVKPEKAVLTEAPLSYAQTGVYFDCLKNPVSTIYNIPYLLTFPASIDAKKLAKSVVQLYEAHPALQMHFEMKGDAVVQTTDGCVALEVPVSKMTLEELNSYKNKFVRPFNLQKAPLCRFEVVETEEGVHLLLDIHHLVFDGGSGDLFIRQLCQLLNGNASVEREQYNYLDFVADQQAAENSDGFKQASAFFAEKLQNCEGASEIPADLNSDEQGFIGEAVAATDLEKASEFCRKQGITPAHLYYAATSYVVSRYTGQRDVYLCTVSGGRSNLKIADTVGMFVNTLALGLSIDDVTVGEFLDKAGSTFTETLTHESYPLAKIAADYNFRPSIAYAYQVGVLSEYQVGGQPVSQELLELNVPKFKINIKIENRGVVVQYDDALYSTPLAEHIAESIAAVAARMMENTAQKVRQLSIVSESQEKELENIREVGKAELPFHLFHHAVEHWAQVQPEHPALVACDESFTYADFDAATNRIAHALQKRGVKARDRVALLLPRTSRLILSMFGVMKAGAAYIPCDPEYPADRVKLILEDSEAQYIITTSDRLDGPRSIDVEELLTETDISPVETDVTPDDLAYLIYTSGSTGRPKGVMLRHDGICNYLYGHPYNVFANAVATDATRVLSVTTISFDAALQDIGTSMYSGKTLVVATEEQANNPLALADLIKQEHIDLVSGTPSRWLTWLTSDVFCDAIKDIKICRAGGEKFSRQLLEQLRSATTARIFNCYGPTEITVASNNAELTHAEVITVGRPQLGVREFIVDNDGNELPVGVVGELYIGGRGVGRGYNNLEEMTRERYVEYHGVRVYRSGDYAKWLPDGNVVILGRTDNQIKLRGLRIELGEIENVILKVEGVKKVVILIRKIGGKEHLCAYYTADHQISGEAMKEEISKSLTQYMVPTAYLQMDVMPMTPNGKTDVKALPEPELTSAGVYEAPANDTEKAFCDIFGQILQLEKVGANDNFFDLGGTSLVVTRVIIEADKAGMHIAYGDVFDNPTPRKLAYLVTGEKAETTGADEISNFDYTAINNLLRGNTLEAFRKGERTSLGKVLLTGSTGYLGIHILRELIDSDATEIHCMVRGKTPDKAESRLKTMLFYYFGDSFKTQFAEGRLKIVLGDVTQDFSEDLNVDTIFNCAAIVKHFAEGTEIEDVNIGGAQRCVDYCLKTGARLIHISTASTRGLSVNDVPAPHDVFTEQRLYMGQFLGNKYIYSKYMAERLILDAIANHRLKAKIMRVGNLAARSTDGEFQMNFNTNSFMGRIRIFNMLGCCPYAMRNKRVEFSPINEVSHAIVLLATTPDACCVFHPYNNHSQLLGDVLEGLSGVTGGIRFVEQEEFSKAMEEAGSDPVKAAQLSGLLAYQDMAHGQKTADVERDNNYTTQVLYRMNYVWSPTSWDYVEKMLTAIGSLGFFD